MTAQQHGRLLNRLASIPRILAVRDEDAERVYRNGDRDERFADTVRDLERRVRKLEGKV